MSSKDAILTRIREALRTPAPVPGHHASAAPAHEAGEFTHWLPAVGEDEAARLALFAQNAAELKAEFHLLPDAAALPQALCAYARENGWQRVATHPGVLTDATVPALGLPTLQTTRGYNPAELERVDAGISECDALVAQTGSVLITALSAGGRTLSVLPPHHVVLARREQLIADLPAAYTLLRAKYGEALPSFISFITGPSRTGDIERILVLGAHGPKRLTIFCV